MFSFVEYSFHQLDAHGAVATRKTFDKRPGSFQDNIQHFVYGFRPLLFNGWRVATAPTVSN